MFVVVTIAIAEDYTVGTAMGHKRLGQFLKTITRKQNPFRELVRSCLFMI